MQSDGGSGLVYEGYEHVRLDGYRFIILKWFRLPDSVTTPAHALELLLRDAHYRDDYDTPDSQDWDTRTRHGPFRVDAITVQSFEPVSAAAASRALQDLADLHGGPSPEVAERLEDRVLRVVADAPSHWRLRDPGPAGRHDFSHILNDFVEIVTVDLDERVLVLVVGAED
ncbi:hypothetical protein [Miltoncostaea oceani]|uniref:hypothetical protein n=1 Tax=Miltoncostaea oceani TaxID=2843216 RepID=UPI001C3C945E|nr:hypothetical protein [Miltoncostaea oceani]